MIEKIAEFALWALAIGGIFVFMGSDNSRHYGRQWSIGGKPGIAGILGAALFMLLLTGCSEPKRVVTALKPPSERLQCAPAGDRPTIVPEYRIDWSRVLTVPQARSEHDAYVRSVRTREGVVAGYIVSLEGKLFVCSNNAAWLREWFTATD